MSIDSGLRQAEEITRDGEYHFAADSVAEARALLKSQGKAIDALQAKLDAVRAIAHDHVSYMLDQAAKFGRTKPDCVCELCLMHEAIGVTDE